MDYKNQKDIHLMTWETVESKRNTNNIITFNASNKDVIEAGDRIICPQGGCRNSIYEITEIVEVRESSLPKMNYITAKTKWYKS